MALHLSFTTDSLSTTSGALRINRRSCEGIGVDISFGAQTRKVEQGRPRDGGITGVAVRHLLNKDFRPWYKRLALWPK